MYLTAEQRAALKRAAGEGIHAINHQVFRLRTENPGAFHCGDSLHDRSFINEPVNGEPFRTFLYAAPRGNTVNCDRKYRRLITLDV